MSNLVSCDCIDVVNAFARWRYGSRRVRQLCHRSRGSGNWRSIQRVSRRPAKTAAWFCTRISSSTTRGPSSSSCQWWTTSAVWWQSQDARTSARTATRPTPKWKRSWASPTWRHQTHHISSTIVSSYKFHSDHPTKTSYFALCSNQHESRRRHSIHFIRRNVIYVISCNQWRH